VVNTSKLVTKICITRTRNNSPIGQNPPIGNVTIITLVTRDTFKEWGSWSPYAGHEGLKRALKKYPTFHRMGGLKRAKTAKRSANGRFVQNE
jgi:hypothetical protein